MLIMQDTIRVEQMEQLLKPKEVCRVYKISIFTLYKRTSLNLIPYIKIGTSVRFKQSDLLEWEKQNLVGHLSMGLPTTKLL